MEKIDRGAHFYRCDFQVHTPRDLSWKGNSYVSDEERKDYFRKLFGKKLNEEFIRNHDSVFEDFVNSTIR